MATPRDRTAAILASTTFNGIDFVTVDAIDPRTLYVHFMNAVSVADPALEARLNYPGHMPGVFQAAKRKAA